MAVINIDRIKIARESRGYSQSGLAKRLNTLSQSMLSKIEKGFNECSDEALEEISEILNYPKTFFYKKHPAYQIKEFYYRKNLSTTVTRNKILEARINLISSHISEFLDNVEIDVNLPYADIADLGLSPERFAQQVRGVFRMPKGPIDDLIGILERRGVIIHFLKFEDTFKFSGISFHTREGVPVILVNDNHPNSRKLFTIAHELGHLLMHDNFVVSDDIKLIERQANEFASNFLMPSSDVKADLFGLTESKLGSLKRYWKVSIQALLFRARALDCLSPDQYRRWITKINYNGWRRNEPGEFLIKGPRFLSKILTLHFEDLNYSLGEVLEMLAINENDFKELYDIEDIAKYTGNKVRKIKIAL